MVAINKVNTNFHHKFEELKTTLHDKETGLVPRVQQCEKAIENIVDVLNDETEGVFPRLRNVEQIISDMRGQLDTIETTNVMMNDHISQLRGTAQVQEKQLNTLNRKVVDITKRSMANNIVISGLTNDDDQENCKEKTFNFLKDLV